MPQFEIALTRSVMRPTMQDARITVEAASEEDARKRAEQMLQARDENIQWEDDEAFHEDDDEDWSEISVVEQVEYEEPFIN